MLSVILAVSLVYTPNPHRSAAVLAAFQRSYPCPANGAPKGPCPGWVKDHIVPLCSGGPDIVANIQWQRLADSKIKDQAERRECAAMRKAAPTR
jgi:hypothetical protein